MYKKMCPTIYLSWKQIKGINVALNVQEAIAETLHLS